jgi:hypothetical protein
MPVWFMGTEKLAEVGEEGGNIALFSFISFFSLGI